jgi:cytoskeletal protein CcmA (bactofilin family)
MFHRVKSEVQEAEQRVQQRQKVDLDYRQEEGRSPIAREAREDAPEMAREEQQQTRSYAPIVEAKEQEEVRPMSNRPLEDKDVQGKYAREQQDAVSQRPRAMEAAPVAAAPTAPSYQRPAATQNAVPRPATYTPSYTSTYSAPSADSAFVGDRTLTIGRGINMSGEIEACDHLVVEGTVEAALKGAKILDIAESGTFYGTVEIEEATIAGRFEGDLTVNGRLTIRASGTITGSVAYRELEVEAGSMIDGRMTPLKGNVDPKSLEKYRAGTDASAMAKSKELLSKKDNREPANTESALFSKAHGSY